MTSNPSTLSVRSASFGMCARAITFPRDCLTLMWHRLVPNQQSFGHMSRWLSKPTYAPLAECPDGFPHPFARDPEPFTLCPTDPRALALAKSLHAELASCFRDEFVLVCTCDTNHLAPHGLVAWCVWAFAPVKSTSDWMRRLIWGKEGAAASADHVASSTCTWITCSTCTST